MSALLKTSPASQSKFEGKVHDKIYKEPPAIGVPLFLRGKEHANMPFLPTTEDYQTCFVHSANRTIKSQHFTSVADVALRFNSRRQSQQKVFKKFDADGYLRTTSTLPAAFGVFQQQYTWINPISTHQLSEAETREKIKSKTKLIKFFEEILTGSAIITLLYYPTSPLFFQQSHTISSCYSALENDTMISGLDPNDVEGRPLRLKKDFNRVSLELQYV